MDPDAARATIIEKANTLLALESNTAADDGFTASGRVDQIATVGVILAEAVHDLDEWLRSGGFFPVAWTPPNSRRANDGRLKDVDA